MRKNIKPLIGADLLLFGQDKSLISQILQPEKPKSKLMGNAYIEYYLKTGFILEYTSNGGLGMIEIVEPQEIEFLGDIIPITNYSDFLNKFLKYDPNVDTDNDGFFSEKFKMGVYVEDGVDDPDAKVETIYLMSDQYVRQV